MWAVITALITTVFPSEGTISFIAHTDGTTRLCLYDMGLDVVTPIGPGTHDREPVWSPDGSKVVFTTDSADHRQIAVAYPNERRVEILKNHRTHNRSPRWSRDGMHIAYETGQFPESMIALYDLNTNTETVWGGGAAGLMRPVWTASKDFLNSRFVAGVDVAMPESQQQSEVLLAVQVQQPEETDQLTTRLVAVTEDSVVPLGDWIYDFPEENYLEWSIEPSLDNQSIAYESNDGGDREIFIAHVGKVFDVTNHRAADWNPVWSPDSKWVAYETVRDGRRAVYRVHRSSGRRMPVLQSVEDDYFSPHWLPNSESLLALRDSDNVVKMILVSIDGSDSLVLDTPYAEVSEPKWRP